MHAARVTGTGAVTAARSRVIGLHVVSGATAGRFTITDGSGGATLYDIDTPASATVPLDIVLDADDGILAVAGIWVSAITNITSVTIHIGG